MAEYFTGQSQQSFEPIDSAFDTFETIINEVTKLDKKKWSEADTRLKVIDQMLFDVLGWDRLETSVEEPAGSGYTNYTLRTKNRAVSQILLRRS